MTILAIVLESFTLGTIYLLIGLSWVIIYRATRVLNFATGQMLFLGALLFWTFSVTLGLNPVVSLLLAAVGNAAVSMVTYDLFLKPLSGRPVFSQIIMSVGFAIILATAIAVVWGNQSKSLKPPFASEPIRIGEAVITTMDLTIIGISIAVFIALLAFLQWSRPGRQMRATAESPLLASQSGIHIGRVIRLSWAFAGVTMALGGIGVAYLSTITPNLVDLGLRGIAPALIAGLDNVKGVIVGAFAMAILENLASFYLGGDVRNVVPFVVILVVLMLRPYGLFGSPEIRRV